MAKIAVIKFSELGDRWDAGFHIINQEYKDRVALIQKNIGREDALATLSAMPAEVLALLQPLVRGSATNRDALIRAATEYPFLSLAIVEDGGVKLLEARKQKAIDEANALTSLIDNKLSKVKAVLEMTNNQEAGAPPSPPDWLTKIDACLESAIKGNNFVGGVVYFDGDDYSIPVETSKTAYVADCWVISADGLSPGILENLVNSGEVPVPRRPEDLGEPVGYFDGLPDHTVNYGKGWRM